MVAGAIMNIFMYVVNTIIVLPSTLLVPIAGMLQ
jgi:hypothetical protein